MNKVLSTGTQSLYKSVVSKLGNGYVTTTGMQGPVTENITPHFLNWGLQKISQGDQFFRTFSISNPNIASVSERWYGRDIASRMLLNNASPRHRCVVDMTRNNDGGLLRAIFDKFGILRKTLSIAKDGSSVSTVYSRGSSTQIPYITKKVVRDADGKILREVYRATDEHNPRLSYTFVRDAKNGLTESIQIRNSVFTKKEKVGIEVFKQNAADNMGNCKSRSNPAGLDASIRNDEENLLSLGWPKFLTPKFAELTKQQ